MTLSVKIAIDKCRLNLKYYKGKLKKKKKKNIIAIHYASRFFKIYKISLKPLNKILHDLLLNVSLK